MILKKYDKNIKTADQNLCMQLLLNRKGVCRHRAYAAMVLFIYLGIPTRIIKNDVHSYIEIYVNKAWHRINLGGGPGNIKEPPALKLKSKIEKSEIKISEQKPPELKASEPKTPEQKAPGTLFDLKKITRTSVDKYFSLIK